MPSQEMQEVIDYFRWRRAARANQPPATLEERRAAFAPAGRLQPLPEDVTVTDVDAGGVSAHWLVTPEAKLADGLIALVGESLRPRSRPSRPGSAGAASVVEAAPGPSRLDVL